MNISANWTDEVKMMDIFDSEVFKHDKFGELVSFETFLQNNPRKLVMVQYCHASFCRPCKDERLITKTRALSELSVWTLKRRKFLASLQSKHIYTQNTASLK